MIRWLEDNLMGQVLAGIAGVLIVLMLLLGVVWSLPPDAGGPEADDEGRAQGVDVPQLPESPPIEAFAVVTDRPVFNESRQPELEVDAESEGEGGDAAELAGNEVEAPEFELAGVVITPSLRMVTLRQKKEKESLVAFEGQPLQGDFGSWHVSRIWPREILLASGDGREVKLQLQVHDAKIAPPPKPEPAKVAREEPAEGGGEADGDDRPMTRAEEIRQRIAERREELRRAAEEQNSGDKPRSDYQTAIQAMIGAKTTPKENDDEE